MYTKNARRKNIGSVFGLRPKTSELVTKKNMNRSNKRKLSLTFVATLTNDTSCQLYLIYLQNESSRYLPPNGLRPSLGPIKSLNVPSPLRLITSL